MEKLKFNFVVYLATILFLVVGATNYWLYQNTAERIKSSLEFAASSKLEGITGLSGFYLSHYEYELLKRLVANTVAHEGVLFVLVKNLDGDIAFEAGQRNTVNSRLFSGKIEHGDEYLGVVELLMDETQSKNELQQALMHSVVLTIFTILLIGALVFLFFRSRVMEEVRLAHAQKDLARLEKEFFSAVMDSSSSLVLVINGEGKIILANNACDGYVVDGNGGIEDSYLWDIFSMRCDDLPLREYFSDKNINALKDNNCISFCNVNNENTVIEWVFDILKDGESSEQLIATGVDVTVKYRESEKLSHIALHDPLTGLPNRVLFMDRLEMALSQYRRTEKGFCLLYLDLDKFKPINDRLGHEAGDYVLKTIAEILRTNLRETDTAARLGGDEFGIILAGIKSRADAENVAKKCIEAISQPVKYLSHELQLGVSIGIACYSDYNCDLVQLINYADTAMYEVKQSGRNGYRFYEHEDSGA